jgi:hypothetical protein
MCGVSNAFASAEYDGVYSFFDCYYYECSETLECSWNIQNDEYNTYYNCYNGDCEVDCEYGVGFDFDIACGFPGFE